MATELSELPGGAEIARAAERLGLDERTVALAYLDFWSGVRAYLEEAHENGLDPRVPSGRVMIPEIGVMYCKPGPKGVYIMNKTKKRRRSVEKRINRIKKRIDKYAKREEGSPDVQQHRDDGGQV